MANETTTTSWTTRILAEVIAPMAVDSHNPKMVVSKLCNVDSIDGERAFAKAYPKYSDLGASSAATEGTDISANTELAMATDIVLTPTEAAAVKATLTGRAVRRATGASADAVAQAIASENVQALMSIIMPDAMRLSKMNDEKIEDDCANLLSGFSNTVGSTGVDLTVAVMVNAVYTLKTLDPIHEDWAFVLAPNQIKELQLELAVTGGGLGGSVWFQQAEAGIVNHAADGQMNGYRGAFLGIPVYEYSHSLRTLMNANADVAGALLAVGRGAPDSGQPGAFAYLEGAPRRFFLEKDESLRAFELGCVDEYAVAELDDSAGVTIVSDAP